MLTRTPPPLNSPLDESLKRIEKLITREAESFIDAAERLQEFGNRLERTRRLMAYLGDPQYDLDIIHIGGTSGKGSIAMMCDAMLRASGLKVGTHTSPYLQTPLEKVRVGGRLVSASEAIAVTERVMKAVTELQREHPNLGHPHYAEAWLALALRHFADQRCQVGVVEVGMGGRYDATNIVLPRVSVISTVHYDHIRVLGDTLAEIAFHKAGIMKPGVPAVVVDLLADAMVVVEEEAARYGTRLIRVGKEVSGELRELSEEGGYFDYRGISLNLDNVVVALPGAHQIENAVTALAAVETFADSLHVELDEAALREGLRSVRFAGRIEVMQHEPTVILDGAHNEEKIEALVSTLHNLYRCDRLILVLGMLESKNAEPIVRTLASLADRIITTAPSVKGKPAIPADALAATAREIGTAQVVADGGPMEALQQALQEASPRDLVVVTGSLYLIGEVRSYWHNPEQIIERRRMFPNNPT